MQTRSRLAALSILVLAVAAVASAQVERAERFTKTVSQLGQIAPAKRAAFAANPEGKTPAELNRLAPEIQEIELDNALSAAEPSGTLRLAAWNMERGRHWREGVRLLREHPALRDADILFLGEMDLGMARSHNEHTTRELAMALGMNYAYGVEFLELSGGEAQERKQHPGENDFGYHGNAILSRFPLKNVRMIRFPGIEKWYGSKQHRLGGRNAILADIEVGKNTVTLVSTHLESGLQDDAIRAAQGRLILQELEAHAVGNPVLLGGDFNSLHTRPVVQGFREAGFQVEACNDLGSRTSQRSKGGKVTLVGAYIDYILVRGAEVVPGDASPAVILAAYPPEETGKPLGDHAIVTVKVQMHAPAS